MELKNRRSGSRISRFRAYCCAGAALAAAACADSTASTGVSISCAIPGNVLKNTIVVKCRTRQMLGTQKSWGSLKFGLNAIDALTQVVVARTHRQICGEK